MSTTVVVPAMPVTLSDFSRDKNGVVTRTALEAKAEAVMSARAAGISIRAFCRAWGVRPDQILDRKGNPNEHCMHLLALWHMTCGIDVLKAALIAASVRTDSKTGLFLNWSPFSALNTVLVGGGELDEQAIAKVNAELAKIVK